MPWNGFAKCVVSYLMDYIIKEKTKNPPTELAPEPLVWLNVTYTGAKDTSLVKSLVQKLHRYLKKDTKTKV